MSRTSRLAIAVLAALGLLTAAGGAVAVERLLLPPAPGDGETLTLLLMGSDEGPKRSADPRRGRADGFQILSVSGDRQHATFVSMPRDSYIPVPGRGTTRINACLNSGPDNCVATVEQEFGIEVDGYLLTSMGGFAEAIADFGGVTVDVERPLFNGGTAIPEAGEQRLQGSQALTYARDRKNRPGGDFGRSQAQAELLAIGHREVVAEADVRAVLEAATILRRHTVTDLSATRMVELAFEAMHLPPENVERHLASASHGRAGAAAIVRLDQSAYDLIRDAADDGRVG